MRQIELTPKELLVALLNRWKMMVTFGLVLALLVGGLRRCRRGEREADHGGNEPQRDDQQPTQHDGRQRRDLRLQLELLQPLLQPGLEGVGALAGFT